MSSRSATLLALLCALSVLALALQVTVVEAGPQDVVPNDPAAQRQYISNRFGSSSRVKQVRDAVPRFGGPSNFEADSDYLTYIIKVAIIGASFAGVTLLIWMVYTPVTCCCCKPNANGYKPSDWKPWMIVGFVSSLVIIAFAIIGAYSTETFDDQVSGSLGAADIAINMLTHTDNFFAMTGNDLQYVQSQALLLAPAVAAAVNNFTDLGRGLPGFLSDFTTFSDRVAAIDPVTVHQFDPYPVAPAPNAPKDPLTFACSSCKDIQNKVNAIVTSMDQTATPTYNQVANTKQAANDQVVQALPTIQDHIDSARTQVGDVQSKANDYQQKVRDRQDDVNKYEKNRRQAVLALFLVPMVICLLFWIFTLGLKSEGCTKVLTHLCFFFGFIMWLIFTVHLPLSVLTADACAYLDSVEVDLSSVSALPAHVGDLSNACLAQQSLIVALGVANDLNFTSAVTFPPLPSVDALLNDNQLLTVNNQIQALDLSTFPDYNVNDKYTQLNNLNSYTDVSPYYDAFSLYNASSCNYTKYGGNANNVRTYRNLVVTAMIAETTLNSTIAQIKTNMTNIVTEFNTLKNLTRKLLTQDVPTLQYTITPLLNAGNQVINDAYCNPLDQDYADLKHLVCSRMIASVSGMAMSSFFVGIFLFFLNFSMWFLMYRIRHDAALQMQQNTTAQLQYGIHSVNNATSPTSQSKIEMPVNTSPLTAIATPSEF